MVISIIIIVKNDRGIKDTLESLRKIKKPMKTEIIVVDASNGSLDDIKHNFKEVIWIYYNNDGKKEITIPEQRNLGIKISKGKLIVFLDANCVPEKNWLIKLVDLAINFGEKVVAGNAKPIDANTVNTISDERYKGDYLKDAPTINLLISKEVFKSVGLFDEKGTFGEDVDLTWRAVRSGYRIKYAKDAVVYHDWGSFTEQLTRMFRYGTVRPQLYKKHPYKIKEIFFGDNKTAVIYPLFILLLPVTLFFPYYPLLLLIPALKNYNSKPLNTVLLNLAYGIGILNGLLNIATNNTFYYKNN